MQSHSFPGRIRPAFCGVIIALTLWQFPLGWRKLRGLEFEPGAWCAGGLQEDPSVDRHVFLKNETFFKVDLTKGELNFN